MAFWKEYLFPRTVEEALEMLTAHDGKARLIAGGTDLVLQVERGQVHVEVMVDITRIRGLHRIEEREGWICIGPQTTHAQVAAFPLVKKKAGILAQACRSVGGPQIRHVGTLVGNVVNAMPAADGAVALFVLDAELEVTDRTGREWHPIAHLYAGVGRCRVDPCAQMVTSIRFRPLPPEAGWAYLRLAQRKALILPMLNVAVVVEVEGGHFREARIAIGPVATMPLRATDAEEVLRGAPVDEASIAEAARLAQEAASPRDSVIRGSAEYRKAMVGVLVRRALEQAVGYPR
ncbi:MAG: FAD binding domain-containing protein [Chloroflexia bacterium]